MREGDRQAVRKSDRPGIPILPVCLQQRVEWPPSLPDGRKAAAVDDGGTGYSAARDGIQVFPAGTPVVGGATAGSRSIRNEASTAENNQSPVVARLRIFPVKNGMKNKVNWVQSSCVHDLMGGNRKKSIDRGFSARSAEALSYPCLPIRAVNLVQIGRTPFPYGE